MVRDRFQGAVVGLWLVPVALGFSSILRDSNRFDADTQNINADESSWASGNRLAYIDQQIWETLLAAIARSLNEIDTFLCSPRHLDLKSASTAVSSLPVLLRYHSDAKRRCYALLELAAERKVEKNAQRLAQQLVLGDVLSMAFSVSATDLLRQLMMGWPELSLSAVAALGSDASDYGLSSLQYRCYQELWQALEERMLGRATASDAVVEGIAIALSQPNSYPAALQTAWQQSIGTDRDIGKVIDRSVFPSSSLPSASVESAMVAGVVCGALGGRQSLPVLWQLQTPIDRHYPLSYLKRSYSEGQRPKAQGQKEVKRWTLQQTVELADCLFEEWAGITRKLHTIIPR